MKLSISRLLLVVAALIALMTVGAAGYRLWLKPLHLRVAAGPPGSEDVKMLTAFNRMLDQTHAGVRLDVTPAVNPRDALEKGEVDMAVVRLDDTLPTNAGVVALLRTNLLIAVAPGKLNLDDLKDVRRRRIGLVARSPLDLPGFLRVLAAFGIKPMDVHIDLISADEVANLTRTGHIEVVVVAGAPSDPEVQAVVNAVAGSPKYPPTILSVDLGDINSGTPAGSAETISDNAFPRLGIPDDEVDTIGVKTALVANTVTGPLRQFINNNAIKEVTRSLIERHGELAHEAPIASLISAPDKDDDARFPVHPGTSAYINDDDTSVATLFSDQIWNIVFVAGAVSSVFAAAGSFLVTGGSDPLLEILGQLKAVTERAEASTDPAEAPTLSHELRELSFKMTELGYQRGASYEEFAPLQLAWESAREAIATLRAGQPLRAGAATEPS